jgi:hypothetical protein
MTFDAAARFRNLNLSLSKSLSTHILPKHPTHQNKTTPLRLQVANHQLQPQYHPTHQWRRSTKMFRYG